VADLKISQLTALAAAGVDAAADVLPIVDSSAVETKKITVANLKTAVAPDLSAYAPLASPTFTGTPSLPTGTTGVTQSASDNSTKLATTAYADAAATAAASASTLDNLNDVMITSVSSGQLLSYNGSAWVNSTPVAAFNPIEAAVFL